MSESKEVILSFEDKYPEEIIINDKASTPGVWIAAEAAIDGYEKVWREWQKYAVLPWNPYDANGRSIPEPKFMQTK